MDPQSGGVSTDCRRLSVCIVSHNAYGAMRGGNHGFIGGVEWQTSLLARWLAARGHSVSLVTWNEGGPPQEVIDGVRVLKICRPNEGLPGLRFVHPKWTRLARALRQAGAEVYYQNGGECVTGQVALWCQRHGRGFVFSLASNADCDPRLPELRTVRERVLYRLGVRRATRVVAQTRTQQQRLRELFGVEAQVIPMPAPGPSAAAFAPPDPGAGRVLWVGRVCAVKRPDRFLDLAAQCPELTFDLVGPLSEDALSQSVRERGGRLPNVVLHGRVAKEQVGEFYRRAAALCCTSDYEGFPNTFLEAWSHGLPVVSTFDPDGIIAQQGLGVVVNNPAALRPALNHLLADRAAYAAISRRCREYYAAHHTVEAVMPQFEQVLGEAARP